LLWILLANLFFLYNCCWTLIAKNIIITFWAFFTMWRLRFFILDTKIIICICEIILVLLNFLNESHIYKIFYLLFLIFSPVIFKFCILILFNWWFRIWIFLFVLFFLFLFLNQLLMFLSKMIFKKLFLMSFKICISKLFNSS
jgi:hypothetical protein